MLKVNNILRLAAVTACLGFGLRALFSDLPIRALVWDEQWWGWCARLVGLSWKEWVTSASVDAGIETIKFGIGTAMVLISGLIATVNWKHKIVRVALWIAFVFLLIQDFLSWKEHFWQIGQLLELSLLTSTPLLYLKYGGAFERPAAASTSKKSITTWIIACLVAFTFIGHGLYAAGVHPVPANFVMMTQASLGVGEGVARKLLFTVGLLDFLAAALLLLPRKKTIIIALAWIIPWAILTTLARWWSYQGIVEWNTLLTQWLPEVIIRLPHILVPLVLWRLVRSS
ncbi:MAG: hypothetical protein AB8H12_15095 [Lewinella sp.]